MGAIERGVGAIEHAVVSCQPIPTSLVEAPPYPSPGVPGEGTEPVPPQSGDTARQTIDSLSGDFERPGRYNRRPEPPALGRRARDHRRRWLISQDMESNSSAQDSPAPSEPAVAQTALSAREFAIEVARMVSDTRCHNVRLLDVTGISPVTDFLVIATGTSPRQMQSACEAAEEYGEPHGFHPHSTAGVRNDQWSILDFFDVVLHVFNPESRLYYDLDNLWGDARIISWERDQQPAGAMAH